MYDKQKALSAAELDAYMKTFATGVKALQSQRMCSLLVDIHDAMRVGAGPSVVFSTDAVPDNDKDMHDNDESQQNEGAAKEGGATEGEGTEVEKDVFCNGSAPEEFHVSDARRYEDEVHARFSAPDNPQPAVITDSSHSRGDDVHPQDVNSPIRCVEPL